MADDVGVDGRDTLATLATRDSWVATPAAIAMETMEQNRRRVSALVEMSKSDVARANRELRKRVAAGPGFPKVEKPAGVKAQPCWRRSG